MTEKEMKRLSRGDLLEMLIDQSQELQRIRKKLSEVEDALQKRELAINTAGSIAEASLRINGVFEAAQASSQQYIENIRLLSERQAAVCAQLERESQEKAERLLSDTEKRCAALEKETRTRCAEMQTQAQEACHSYWMEVTAKLEAFYEEHAGLRELLSRIPND